MAAKQLVLRVIARQDETEPSPIFARFDSTGGFIGRADTARLILPDPKRNVSRFHAHVSCIDGNYYVEDMGSTNPAVLNDRVLPSGEKAPLAKGDRLRIADYTLAVEFEDPQYAPTIMIDRAAVFGDSDEEIAVHTRIATPEARRAVLEDAGVMVPRGPVTPEDMLNARLAGAQVTFESQGGARPEFMRTVGMMLRSLVAGVRRLVQLRTEAKGEMGAEQTTLRPRSNNPLKLAADDARALAALLRPPMHGFLAGPEAVDDAMIDLISHARASHTAMYMALERVLQQYEPDVIEARLNATGGGSSWLPMGRKAKLWDAFVETQRLMKVEARGGFQDAFNRAFLEAYETEVARLKRELAAGR
jgi:predicted component of type VI protein secretion system